ncbi:uncharacterized protein LOC111643873, partial [Copidosoma floridanum]|uniref:uncharacterized protein LOC111643873 n=1 Tax=Copidosoma floridanum TaxID=29053 RepID=UPI000C6F64AF
MYWSPVCLKNKTSKQTGAIGEVENKPTAEGGDGPASKVETTWGDWKAEIVPSDAGNAEYVALAKSDRNSYEDPLDRPVELERHHSGHFRHSQSKVWDPHPRYDFVAFGHAFHVHLKEDRSFAPPGVT